MGGDLKRFMFDNLNFDPDAPEEPEVDEDGYVIDSDEEIIPEEPPAPTFSEEELAAAQNQAFEDGKAEGIKHASEQIENMLANALTQIAAQLPGVFQAHSKSQELHEANAVEIANVVTRKMLPALTEKSGADEVVNVVSQCLEPLRAEPRLIVKVHETIREEVHERLVKIGDDMGFDGRIIVMPHEDLVPGDCKLEWSEGGAERKSEDLWQQIEEIIQRNLTDGAKEGEDQPQTSETEVNDG